MIQPLVLTDFYKTDHRRQYPPGTSLVYSNFTPRASRIPGVDQVVVFGIQYFIKEYLQNQFNQNFFNVEKRTALSRYKRRLDYSLGKDAVPIEHIAALHDLDYLPLQIKALPEGTLCPIRVPCLTIRNTLPEYFWLPNFLETILSTVLWGPMTSATIAHEYRKKLDFYAELTSDIPEFVQWQGHDFSMRGMYGLEAATLSGAAHLLSFTGTDTIPAIDFLEQYYGAISESELIGGSVPATEHSVMSLGGDANEKETIRRLITEVYPTGIVSIVSDTWDFWKVISQIARELKDTILARDGKVVFRPDSGDPVKIICGTPYQKGAIDHLWDIFGGTINSKGFKQLNSKVGLIYGDSITLERCKAICQSLAAKGFASTNIVFGIGSYTYQYNTRDTFGFAMKATYGVINGEEYAIYKDPVTDDGEKKSARGLLHVTSDMELMENVSWELESQGLLETIFLDGAMKRYYSLKEIRERLQKCRS
jgi:nicotinamide phosphoribosyltransferase